MEEFRIPKRRMPVEILLAGGATRRVLAFLTEVSADHSGTERLSELLNEKVDFIPVVDVETNKISFLNRLSVAVARVATQLEEDPSQRSLTLTQQEVELTLGGGQKLRGTFEYALPPEQSRLNDFLNVSPTFIKLVERDRVALVNKQHVTLVEEVTARTHEA